MSDKILLKHLEYNREALLKYSKMVSIAEHTGNLGTAREAIISSFLEENLPQFIQYHSGEIFDSEENRSGQIDIVLHPITAPKLHLYGAINLFPAETVLATMEVKSMLNKKAVYEALGNCNKVKALQLRPKKRKSEGIIDNTTIPFILFAFKSNTKKTIIKNINKWYEEIGKKEPYFSWLHLPDLIVVLETNDKIKNTIVLIKSPNYRNAGLTIDTVYITGSTSNPLYNLFEFLVKTTQFWASSPSENIMPVERYVKTFRTLFSLTDLFDKK